MGGKFTQGCKLFHLDKGAPQAVLGSGRPPVPGEIRLLVGPADERGLPMRKCHGLVLIFAFLLMSGQLFAQSSTPTLYVTSGPKVLKIDLTRNFRFELPLGPKA